VKYPRLRTGRKLQSTTATVGSRPIDYQIANRQRRYFDGRGADKLRLKTFRIRRDFAGFEAMRLRLAEMSNSLRVHFNDSQESLNRVFV
jgi:hypothetical protein